MKKSNPNVNIPRSNYQSSIEMNSTVVKIQKPPNNISQTENENEHLNSWLTLRSDPQVKNKILLIQKLCNLSFKCDISYVEFLIFSNLFDR